MIEGNTTTLPQVNNFAAVRRIAVNMTSLLTSDVLNRAAMFAVYVLVARHCGPKSFGQLSLGLMLLYTFQVFASAGLPTLITREVAKRPESTGRYLANASLIVVCTSLISLVALLLFVFVSRYPQDTREVVLLLGLSVLPWSLTTICEGIFKAWERMHLIVLVAIPVNVFKVGASYYLLASGHDVGSIAIIFLASYVATLVLEWVLLFCYIRLREVSFDLSFCRFIVSRAWRFLGIDSVIAIWASTNTVLLSWFADETAVGLFGAAWQLLVPVSITLQAVANSLFPIMCRHAEGDRRRMQQLTVWMLEVMLIVAVPGCVLLYFGAGPLISAVYRHSNFASSIVALRIMLPVLLLQVIATTFGLVLYSRRQEHVTLRIVTIDFVFNLLCGVVLIYAFGLVGAAIVAALTWTFNAYLHYAATREALTDEAGQGLPWNSTLISHVFAAGCVMACVLAVLNRFNFIVASILTSCLYLALLGALVFVACRGSMGFRERFLVPLSEL